MKDEVKAFKKEKHSFHPSSFILHPCFSRGLVMRKLIALILLISLFGAAQLNESRAQQRRQPQPRGSSVATETLIRNATILTVSHGTLQNSDILIRGGKIAAIGQNLTAPTGARALDATGT